DNETRRQVQYIHQLIKRHIGSSATSRSLEPLWYRGLSDVQLDAVNALSINLCEDIMEGSTYRVYDQLNRLGIYPKPSKKQMIQLLFISRGNDVAFLWFLMEMCYKSDNRQNIYTMNEQIILSAIFCLDLHPTLEELDRLLPLPHESAERRQKQFRSEGIRMRQAERRQQLECLKLHKRPKAPSKSPYFDKPLSHKYRRRTLTADYPNMALRTVPAPEGQKNTLRSRWFGDYVFNPGERIARTVLRAEIDNVLKSLTAAKVSKSHVESMCTHHKQIKEMEQSLQMKLEVFKRDQACKLLDVGRVKRLKQREETLKQLERLSEQYQSKFHAMAIKTRLDSTRKRLCADIYDPEFIYIGSGDAMSYGEPCLVENTEKVDQKPKPDCHQNMYLLDGNDPLPPTCRDNAPRQVGGQEKKPNKEVKERPSSLMRFLLLGGTEDTNTVAPRNCKGFKVAKLKTSPPPAPKASTEYFKLGKLDYKFNYRKLFGPTTEKLLDDAQLKLKVDFIKALDADVEYINAVLDGDLRARDACIDRTAQRMFQAGTDMFNKEYEQAEVEIDEATPSRLDFGLEYYDADNMEQMKLMLQLGLEHVARDRRYVLPTLPNVHSVPLLIDWIRSRYGKHYSQVERHRNSEQAIHLMDHLAIILGRQILRSPSRKYLSARDMAGSYTARQNAIVRLQKQYKNRIVRHFNLSIMELGRVFQSTMQKHNRINSARTYFAYMPAHIRDVDFTRTAPL
ncbi:hypothetical protein KR222_003384, partial [Zaprionus bogoriensis]